MTEKRSGHRRSLNLGVDIFAQNRTRFSKGTLSPSPRAKRASLVPSAHGMSLAKFNDGIVRTSEMMLTLFIPEKQLRAFVDTLKSAQFCGTSAIRRNAAGDVFHNEWNTFCDSVTKYLNVIPVDRCREFIVENLESFGASLKSLSLKIPLFGPLKKRLTPVSTEMKAEVDDLVAKVCHAKTVEEIAGLAIAIDRLDASLSAKYSNFFEILLTDRTERTSVLFDCSQFFQKATACARKAPKVAEVTQAFLDHLKETTDLFATLIKSSLVRADSVGVFKRRKTMSSIFRLPLTKARSQMRYNKTDKLEVAKVAIPKKSPRKEDESSQETAKMITIPDVSATSDVKPVPKIAPKRVKPKPQPRVDPRQEELKLKEKHEKLREQLEKSQIVTEYEAVQKEVAMLQTTLSELKKAEMDNDDIEQSIWVLRELCNLEGERSQTLEAELVRINQVNDGIQTENATVNFDNISLKKEISDLNDDLHKKRALVEMNRMQRERTLNSDMDEEPAQQTKFLDEDIRLQKHIIAWIEQRIESMSKREPEMNFEIRFEDGKGTKIAKLKEKIAKLEKSLNSRRPNSLNMTIAEQHESLRTSIAMTKATVAQLQKSFNELRNRIERLTVESQKSGVKRQEFDTFEVLKDQAKDCQRRYFALKNQITPSMNCQERYRIELAMDDVQDQYTCVMMEIERIPDSNAQESLRNSRKDRNKSRKETAKLLAQASQVMSECVEQERQAVEKEQELRLLIKNRGTVDERHVLQLSEWIFEKKKTEEVLQLIDNQTHEFDIYLCGDPSSSRRIEELKETIAKLLKTGGAKMAQRLRIYNLRKEIEKLQ